MKLILFSIKRAVVTSAVIVSTACTANAATDAIPRIELNKVPLADAIGNLARQSSLNYIFDPHVPGSSFGPGRLLPQPSVTACWTNVTAQAALSDLLKQHHLTLVTNAATTVTRIAPADLRIKPVLTSRVGTNTNSVVPVVVLDFVPLPEAITKLANAADLTVAFDSVVSAPAFADQGTVSLRWEGISLRQALAALLDNYGLVMTEDSASSTARITMRNTESGEGKRR